VSAHTLLEAVAGADNPYSLIAILGPGHLAIWVGGAIYVTRCAPVEVVPPSHKNCTEEIPALHNRMVVFVDDQLNRLKINHVSESELGPVSMVANNSVPMLGKMEITGCAI
jgi:hypothetical protein